MLNFINDTLRFVNAYGEMIIVLLFLALGGFMIYWYMGQDEEGDTIKVVGYDPRIPIQTAPKDIPLEGETALWTVKDGQDIRFVPKQETQHIIDGKPGWILDLTDGRTIRIDEADDQIRTSGQELEKAVKDETIAQAMNAQEDKLMFYLKLVVFGMPVIILGLIILGFMVFYG